MKRLLIYTFLGLTLISCTTSKNPTSNLIKHPEIEMMYSQDAVEFFKEYNLHMRFGRKRFVVNTDIIQHEIDWVSFDNNKPVYQIDKADDIRENHLKLNPHYLEFDGKKYETDAPDNYFVVDDKLVHYRCLEQKYIQEWDRNECTSRAIYANDSIVHQTDLSWLGTTRLKTIGIRFVEGDKLYYSIYTDKPHAPLNTSYVTNNKIYSYDVSSEKNQLTAEYNDWHIFALEDNNPVIATSDFGGKFKVADKEYNFNISDALQSGGDVYYVPLEDFGERMRKSKSDSISVSLLKDGVKVASAVTDDVYGFAHIENGNRKKCLSYLDPLFTKPFCVIGNTHISKNQVGHSGTKQIMDYDRGIDQRDEYFINGTLLTFYPYFDVPDKYNSDISRQYDETDPELVQGVAFIFNPSNEVEKLLIVTTEPGIGFMNKLYLADYLGKGSIGEPVLLMEYNGTLFGYTTKDTNS